MVLRGASVDGQTVDVRIEDGRIRAVGQVSHDGATVIDHSGRFLVPAFVDSHVHLAYLPAAPEMADGGVAAYVDWASPIEWLDRRPADLQGTASGPMITAEGGYPTQSWGRDGYGAECADVPSCVARVDAHLDAGAKVIKVPLAPGPRLSEEVLRAVVERAHARDALVGAHAFSDADAALAAAVGVDVLVHTPTGRLEDTTVAAWSGRWVISTLDAFGASDTTIDNLRRLREAGATVLYGTDFGNSRQAGIQAAEIAALERAGFDGAAILDAGTTAPASRFGFELGIRPNSPASLLVLDADPRREPATLAQPREVWIAGQRR